MYLEATEHACPHLREQRTAEVKPAVSPSREAGCPFGAARAPAEPLLASAGGSAGGWWAFAAQARAMTASA